MKPRFRAWQKKWKELGRIVFIRYQESGEIAHLSFRGNIYNGLVKPDEIELMQSTGLTDKNGKEIFEGDVLGTKDGLLNGVVEYRTDLGMWTNSLIRYNNFERLCNVAGSREIIGNVYENPELLEDLT